MAVYKLKSTEGGAGSAQSGLINTGVAVAGFPATGAPNAFGSFWDDWLKAEAAAVVDGWTPTPGGVAGTVVLSSGVAGGVIRLASGATLNGGIRENSVLAVVNSTGASRWYQATRARFPLAVDAETMAAVGLLDMTPAKSISIGVHGSSSAVNFTVNYDGVVGTLGVNPPSGSFVSTGKAIDTAFHLFEMWCVGDNILHARVDSGAEVTATMAAASVIGNRMFFQAQNGATAADRQIEIDYILQLFSRAP